jgi:nucleoside 2-deoxyribosyltransferase
MAFSNFLRAHGFDTIMPQDDALTPDGDILPPSEIFKVLVEGINRCDCVLALCDGADVDSGTAWELGYAYAIGRPAVLLRTDFRRAEAGPVNIMLEHSASRVVDFPDPSADIEPVYAQVAAAIEELRDSGVVGG